MTKKTKASRTSMDMNLTSRTALRKAAAVVNMEEVNMDLAAEAKAAEVVVVNIKQLLFCPKFHCYT